MKIGIIQPRLSYYNGGGEKYCMDSLIKVANKTKDIFIIYTTKSPLKNSKLYNNFKKICPENIKIKEISVPAKWKKIYSIKAGEDRFRWDSESLFFNKEILPLIENEKIDVIWSYYILDSIILPPNIPCILNLLGYPRQKSAYSEGLLSQYSEIVPISKNVLNKWNNLLDKKIDNFKILNQGIDCSKKFKNNPYTEDSFNIVFAGRFIERKGIQILLKSVHSLLQQNKHKLKIYLFGEGEYKKEIQKLIAQLKLDDCVKIYPFVKDVEKYFYYSDVCIFPSFSGEGLMSVVLEAMFYNGLVITTEDNGNEEAIINNKNGFLIPQGDTEALSNKIDFTIKNPKIIQNIKSKAKKTIEEKFNWEVYCNNFLKIINKYRK